MRRLTVTLFFIFLSSLTVLAQQPCKPYGPAGSILSFCPPAGMTVKKEPGDLHAGFLKVSPDGKDAVVLVINESQVDISLGEFGYEMISSAYEDASFTDTTLITIGEYPTANGLRGLRLVFLAETARKGSTVKDKVERIFYLYEGPKGARVFFNALFPSADTTAETLIDNAMKTIKIKK